MSNFTAVGLLIILGLHTAAAFLRWLVARLEKSSHDTLFIILCVCISGGLLALRLPPVHDWLKAAIMSATPDFTPMIFLIEITLLTLLLRMLFEQFVLSLPYNIWEWIVAVLVAAGWTTIFYIFPG